MIAILKLVSAERSQSHFTAIIDRGKKETFFFLVMQLVFSMSTGLGVGIQCLEACQDLHKFGFIHRDLKPANYACGLGEKRRIVYILDFGIARKILNLKGEIKAPRQYVKFKVSVKYMRDVGAVVARIAERSKMSLMVITSLPNVTGLI
ncbi:hypothetical protein OESDEN_02544 [Oesophagostomum dentatum]|uniref:Protein kinase domain-containing protein n=1 Tax=Oesophagostomum dentatum TaxID=61180 RepID=A0A0B1TNQ6_OESDE|nr:hypothetical protein OESDEN_02544 [Oesophagostomum dentatum]